MKKNKLTARCFRADGTEIMTNPETGKFDPPVKLPAEIHFEMLRIANLANGIEIKMADDTKKENLFNLAV
ncbi:hypothetical protein [Enterococcus xiangfangensis]|uniref:hypothetical protein n=1 Tax=Enterococcus xiangfangensis TaxID=1296537 RepID=UPI003D166C83|nr:hypothetical protein [Enterococcus asini]